jgi:hypothetical protein
VCLRLCACAGGCVCVCASNVPSFTRWYLTRCCAQPQCTPMVKSASTFCRTDGAQHTTWGASLRQSNHYWMSPTPILPQMPRPPSSTLKIRWSADRLPAHPHGCPLCTSWQHRPADSSRVFAGMKNECSSASKTAGQVRTLLVQLAAAVLPARA